MKIFPAIDMYDGKVVRLYKGDYNEMTVYSDDPLKIAKQFENAGAEYIHLVDLEGAKVNSTPNFEYVKSIAQNTGLKVEIGGGIRSVETVEKYLNAGVWRVILGTAAIQDPKFLKSCVDKYGEKVAVGVDIKDGFVATHGWTVNSGISCDEFISQLVDLGVDTVICTDISKDGAMKGTNLELYSDLSAKYNVKIVASGGVSSYSDIEALSAMDIFGAIIGKALYNGAIDLEKAVAMSKL